jgi:hypothetical protein
MGSLPEHRERQIVAGVLRETDLQFLHAQHLARTPNRTR